MTKQKQTIGRATTPVRRFRPKPLLGAWDAWNLLAASGAAVAALPLFAGNLSAAAAGLGLSALGGAGLAWPRVRDWLDPVDAEPREGFVLPSDPALADDGPLIGYTRDTNTPVRIPYDLFMHHLGLIGASGGGKTTLLLCVLPVSMQEMVFVPANVRCVLQPIRNAANEQDERDGTRTGWRRDPRADPSALPALAGESSAGRAYPQGLMGGGRQNGQALRGATDGAALARG
jgi:hypothetical protein